MADADEPREQLQQELEELHRRVAGLEAADKDRRRAEETLRQRNRELELLNRANRELSSSLELDQVLTTILEEARHLLRVTSCSIWLVEPETGDLVCRQAADPHSDILLGWRLSPGLGIAGWVAGTGQSAIVPDTRADQRYYRGVEEKTGLENRSLLTVPLRIKERVIGVVQVLDQQVERFDMADLQLFESLAGAAAVAIENARLYQETVRSERKNRALIDAIPDMMIRFSRDGVYLEVIPAKDFEPLAPPSQLLGRLIAEILPAEVAHQQMHLIQQTLETAKIQVHEYQLEVQGDNRHYEARIVAGGDDEALAIIRDVTRRKQTEAAVHRYAGRLKVLHEIDQAILSAQSPEATARAALSHMRRLVRCRRASVIEFVHDGRTARVLATHVDGQTTIKTGVLIPPEALRAELLVQGEVVVEDILELAQPSLLREALLAEGVRAYVSVPLIAQGELIGCLNLGADRPGAFEDRHIAVAREAANSLAVAIRHARLYEQTLRDAKTKARLLQEVNHRVKNNLSAIIGLLYTEQRYGQVADQATYRSAVQDMISRIQGLATVHQLLSAAEWSPVLLSDLAGQVIRAALEALPPDIHMSVELSPSPVLVTPAQANSVALIVNELATNAAKYALHGRRTARITVRISQEDDTILLQFQDDGPGYPDEVLYQERHGVGLYLVKTFVRYDLDGELALGNDKGAVSSIRFKTVDR
jgi:PAS domain S-box-containing protein